MAKGNFPDNPATMTLTGTEWFVILASLMGKPLSKEGTATKREALRKLTQQVSDASDAYKETGK